MNRSEKIFAAFLLQAPVVTFFVFVTVSVEVGFFEELRPNRAVFLGAFLYSFPNLLYLFALSLIIFRHLFVKKVVSPIKLVFLITYPVLACLGALGITETSSSGPNMGFHMMGIAYSVLFSLFPAVVCSLPLFSQIRNVRRL